MNVSAINSYSAKPYFTSNKNGYENPINRGTEKGLAIWGSIGKSLLAGGIGAGIASCIFGKGSTHRAWKVGGIGAAVALGILALTLPAKLYDTKVKAFTREKEMDTFSREKDLQANIMEEVDKQVQDEDIPLEQKVNNYATVQMAKNGNGVMVKGA